MYSAKKSLLRRLWAIDRELHAKTFPTAERLAELNEVNVKTTRRDLETLRTHYQAPLEFDVGKNGWKYTCETFRLPAVIITEGELMALFLAGQMLRQPHGVAYQSELEQAFRKLSQFLPDEVSIHWDTIGQSQSFRQSVSTQQDLDTFRRLADAVLHRRQLRVRYWTASRETETERTIDPYHLTCVDGEWYLVAWCHSRQARRMFVPWRVRELAETGETFSVPTDFRIGEFFDGTFRVVSDAAQPLQTVRLRFAPSAAKYVREKTFHVSQVNRIDKSGSLEMSLSLRSLVEVRRFILSWGSECEVLEPAELRAEIHREATSIFTASRPLTKINFAPPRARNAPRANRKTG